MVMPPEFQRPDVLRGKVVISPGELSVISLGRNNGLKPGTQMVISRNGDPVAPGLVEMVNSNNSVCRFPEGTVLEKGDRIMVHTAGR